MDLNGKRIAILATNGFEQAELEVPRERLKKAGATVEVISLAAGEIRGWDKKDWGRSVKVDKALADLEFSRKRIAQDVRKCVMSAVANAENNHDLDVNSLIVAEAYVGKNLVMKRFAARGRGRGFSIMKPFSQITVVVRETEAEAEKA